MSHTKKIKEYGGWEMIDRLLQLAIDEDVGSGDVTSELVIPEDAELAADFVSRQQGVCAGFVIVERLYKMLDERVKVERLCDCGAHMNPGDKLARVSGPARSILTGERTALNIMQRMSAVATMTHRFVEEVKHTKAKIMDTRKTMPGMRALDKLAVYIGGGNNHRHGLYDMVLIKDNHLALSKEKAISPAQAVTLSKDGCDLPVMVEVDNMHQLREVLSAEPDMVLLDNMNSEELQKAVSLTHEETTSKNLRRPLLEASGGVNMNTVKDIAESGVDRISVGAITHSVMALDIGLDYASE